MPLPYWSDAQLLNAANALQSYLNSGKTLRLFVNNFTPDPTTPRSSFTEATFPGYAAVSLAGTFAAPTLVTPGNYQLIGGPYSFGATSGINVVYGWYIDDGTNVVAAQLLDASVSIFAGSPYAFILRPQEISQSILP